MDILTLIKNRRTIRKYKNKPIPKRILDKIIEAGRWGPSLHGLQPSEFVIITNKKIIAMISDIALNYTKKLYAGYRLILKDSAETIANSQVLIIAYNNGVVHSRMGKMGTAYNKCAKISEIEAISAAIQNIILAAEFLGVGICWLTIPLFCERVINNLLHKKHQMVAILSLGYRNERGRRSKRRPLSEVINVIR